MELIINIVTQGAPVINTGGVYAKGDDVVALEIDMSSKNCKVSATSGGDLPGIYIDATERSLSLDPTKSIEDSTFIEFPQYAGWDVWCNSISKYTLSVCLVRDKQIQEQSHE